MTFLALQKLLKSAGKLFKGLFSIKFPKEINFNELPRSKLRGIKDKKTRNFTPMQASRNSLINSLKGQKNRELRKFLKESFSINIPILEDKSSQLLNRFIDNEKKDTNQQIILKLKKLFLPMIG